jgi:xanthine dehydrogenase YagR molybdenum-binding subunit
MGKRRDRLDGPAKASGRAQYGSDVKQPDLLFGALLTCPHGHALVKSVDAKEAASLKGVTAVRVLSPAGTEIQWAGTEVAVVAAISLEIARDAVRKIKVEYEVRPHLVHDADLGKAGARANPSGEALAGDPDKAFQEADVTSEGDYGIQAITHCTLEPHGQVIAWRGDGVDYWPSTQALYGVAAEIAKAIDVPLASVRAHQQHVGGAFGSKFSAERWGIEGAHLSKDSGGRAVKWYLDRRTDLEIAGSRPSAFARIKLAARKDGTITAWQALSWGSSGIAGGGIGANMLPYVFVNIPNKRVNHIGVSLNNVPVRPWRAPNNSQAAEMIEWKKLWHPRSRSGGGPVKRGLGIGVGTWGGMGHPSQCRALIHPDGSVEVEIASQDLGTGTRTVIGVVAAETLGLEVDQIQVKIGESSYPPSGSSGGSTTVGGVSVSTRTATMNALGKLFEVAAPALGAPADQLEAVGGKIQVKGNAAKSLTWAAACQKLGVKPISEMGENVPKQAAAAGLINQGTGGVQIADVSVDVETGVVKMNRLVAVQDCGLVICPKTAESQIFGACIMSICGALYEERVMDAVTGRMLNGDLSFYKLAGIGDIGEIIVRLDISPEHDKRGVIGLGEPPVIPGIAAIANAVANAIGVRVPIVPLTPDRVLAALEGRNV